MGGYKALIVLIWLTVPAAGYYLLRQDYAEYTAASERQRADCETRIDLLRRYTKLLSQLAGQVEMITDAESRANWQWHWRNTVRELEDQASRLRLAEPLYYPETDHTLLLLEQLLSDQQEEIEQAARERDAYNKAGGDLESMALKIELDRGTAQYYRSIGAYGIYELIRADVARQEDEYQRRLKERNRLLRNVQRALANADQLRSDILDGLERIGDSLDSDEQRSYQLELRARLERFSLRKELRRLVTGT